MGEKEEIVSTEFNQKDVYIRLLEFISCYPPRCQCEAARDLGVGEGNMSQFLSKKRPIPLSVAVRLGFIREDIARPLREAIIRLRKEVEELRVYKSLYEEHGG